MTEDTYRQAQELKRKIKHYEGLLADLEHSPNEYELPLDMFKARKAETKTYLQVALKRVRDEFAAL